MSTMNLSITSFPPLRGSRWQHLKSGVGEWRQRARSRYELTTLSDSCLRDIGISRCSAAFECSKPFWEV